MYERIASLTLPVCITALAVLLCGLMGCTAAAAELPLPAAPVLCAAPAQPTATQMQLLQSAAAKLSLLGVVGIILVMIPRTRMCLFENVPDIILTCLVVCVFTPLLLYDSPHVPIPFTNRVVGMLILLGILVPYSLKANRGRIWTLLVILPGKLLASLVAICGGILFFFQSYVARWYIFSPFGFLTRGLSHLLLLTTRSYKE